MTTRTLVITTIAIFITMLVNTNRQVVAAETQSPEQQRMLIEGAHLWSVYCNQCHNARPGSQFSPAQWDAITMHMKTLSNMPAKDMRAIKAFLKLH
jgi:hypothetical protein